jgi:hypothetical protein
MTNDTIRGHIVGYSDSEIGQRHPHLPLGMMVRDTGQFDLYAGSTRVIGGMSGYLGLLTNSIYTTCRVLRAPNISWYDLSFGHKTINVSLSKELSFISTKKSTNLGGYFIIGPETRVDPNTGEILNKVSASSVFSKTELFEDDILSDNPELEHFNAFMRLI